MGIEFVLEFCREFAPVATVIAGVATTAIIPVLAKLNSINTKLDVMAEAFRGHERLDEARFKAQEQRLNDNILSRQEGQ